ncbi:MAG: DEAD/DEAH box helicase [Chloroflexi bacterium]|nr:DEAD/DEAH box helicase [Chloroflexota bacterium]
MRWIASCPGASVLQSGRGTPVPARTSRAAFSAEVWDAAYADDAAWRGAVNAPQIVEHLLRSPEHSRCVTAFRHVPPKPARFAPFPEGIDGQLRDAYARRGIERVYTHQADAVSHVLAGRNVVVVTPTASGKTLCYNLPVLDAILKDSSTRALYLFPTKALAQDQQAELHGLVEAVGADIKTYTYDGDTPATARRVIRQAGHIVVTNPDMLHTGILPHHDKWVRLFENLRYVVVDELHQYRGVFGSHVANVLRRLRRICAFYGTNPQFICCSATIGNAGELGSRLTEYGSLVDEAGYEPSALLAERASALVDLPLRLVDESGAPSGEKFLLFYNPPVVNKQLGIRRSSTLVARTLATAFLSNGLQTIVFARSRLSVEVLLHYLKEAAAKRHFDPGAIQGYRGGYLPRERRAIEHGIRDGSVRGVVATNALELGIDIGGLEAAVLAGYPGSIASTLQQMGRVGRRDRPSVAVLVGTSSPLDQFIITHPQYFFGRTPESGLVNPGNLVIRANHLRCAAFELPFEAGERFGGAATEELLRYFEEDGALHFNSTSRKWYWASERFPAEAVSLRSAASDNFVIVDTTVTGQPRVIGEMDRYAAPVYLHEEAIYIHGGQQHQVEKLDWEQKKAYVRQVNVDYYTDAELAVHLQVMDTFAETPEALIHRPGRALTPQPPLPHAGEGEGGEGAHAGEEGQASVEAGAGEVRFAHGEVSVTYQPTIFKKIKFDTHENVGWGKIHLPEEELQTAAFWLSLPASRAEGLGREDLEGGLVGLANLLGAVAPLYLMCDPRDVGVVPQVKSPFTGLPTIFVYERVPAGVGFSERLFAMRQEVLGAAADLARECPCAAGCPSCVGPAQAVGERGKQHAVRLALGTDT